MSLEIKQSIADAIKSFQKGKLTQNAINLFNTLGYNTERQAPLDNTTFDEFKDSFIIDRKFDETKAKAREWKYVDLLFQLSTTEMRMQESLFKETVERNEPASYLFFAVELSDKIYTRNQLSQITREINSLFPMHVFIIFKYGNNITLSLIDRRPNKKIADKDVLEKVTHVYNVSICKPHAAHIHIFYTFSFDAITAESRKKRIESFKDLQIGWRKVISTDILNKQFYLDYQKLSKSLIKAVCPSQLTSKLTAHQGVLNLLNRIMFIYFVQKKEWIMKDENFIYHFWKDYQESKEENRFHEFWLNSVFFSAFNGVAYKDPKALKALPEPYKSEIINFPYLNGGLFANNEEYDNFILQDNYFKDIFGFFESYIFTISEDTPYDVNLEINPELLGKMYEGMINATDLDDVDAENGIIYTERPEINFMTRRSFVEVLDKKLKGAFSRDFLYHFVFDEPEQKREMLKRYKANLNVLRQAVVSITACDPSCGSGSMLLGVIQLQMELLRVIDELNGKPHSPQDDFLIKKQLVSECIYGVDIKEWAVRIAELRLWLYMIAEADFTKEELTKTPLLPNLDFKLRRGNSLLQKIGSLDFTLKDLLEGRNKSAGATRKLNEFIKKKKEFIINQNESKTTYKKLKEEEYNVFNLFIDELIIECKIKINNLVKKGKQTTFFPEPEQSDIDFYAKEKEVINIEIEQLQKLQASIHKDKKLPFSYDIDFMEVFLTNDDPGFDLIIGNPPYVRQEQILPPEDGEYLEYLLLPDNKDEKAKINKEYKEELNAKVFKTYPFLATTAKTLIDGKSKTIPVYGSKVPGRSDLYCYFQLLCPSYLNSKGTFCFIISNSWLDVDFGGFIQHFLLKHSNIYAIYDCNVRSFDAGVNTIIYLHSSLHNIKEKRENYYKTLQPTENIVQFVMNKIDYTQAAYAPLLLEQEHCRKNTFNDLYRVITFNQKELFHAGYDEEQLQYFGDKWGGKYLTVPEIMFRIMQLGEEKKLISQLKNLVEGERYLNTGGADGFFLFEEFERNGDYYNLKNNAITEEGKKKGILPYSGNIPIKYLKPLLKDALKKRKTILVNETDALCLVINEMEEELNDYIEWGESNEYNQRSVTKNQKPWYKPTNQMLRGASIIVPRSFNEVFAIHYNPEQLLSLRFYRLHVKDNEKILKLICFLNSTFVILFQEIFGNKSLGQGALDFFMADFLRMKIPIILNDRFENILNETFLKREILSIFNELGFDKTQAIREQHPIPLPDRKELDDIIFDELGLTQEERNEVYWSVAELVKQRLDKAASR